MNTTETRLRGLMIRGLEGDAAAHNQLLCELARLLRSYFGRRLPRDPADIEDLVQETLIAVHTRRTSYDRDRPFTAWAFSMARYKMVDEFRRRGERISVPLEEAAELFADDERDGIAAGVDLAHLMSELPASQRDSIRGVKIDGLSVAEVAQRSGLSPSNVKVSIHRGLKTLIDRVRRGDSDAD